VRLVQQVLVVGVGVHGVEQALADADRLVQHLGQRRQAIGGAGGIGDDALIAEQLVIHAVDHGQVAAIERVRGEYATGPRLQVLLDQRALLEFAGALEHHVDVQFLPRQLGRIPLGQQADRLATHHHRFALQLYRLRETTEGRIEAGQMHQRLVVAEIVDRDHLYPILQSTLEQRSYDGAADTSIPVDGNT